jgi:hypothetical protein
LDFINDGQRVTMDPIRCREARKLQSYHGIIHGKQRVVVKNPGGQRRFSCLPGPGDYQDSAPLFLMNL